MYFTIYKYIVLFVISLPENQHHTPGTFVPLCQLYPLMLRKSKKVADTK